MSLLKKINQWLDRWVGSSGITPFPQDTSADPRSPQFAPHLAGLGGMTDPKKTLEMQDVFFLEERHESAKEIDTVALYVEDPEGIAIRNPISGTLDQWIPVQHAKGLIPLLGRFGGNSSESIGLYDPKSGYFRVWETWNHPKPHLEFLFGPRNSDWQPLIGDWEGDGRDGIGLYCPETSTFLLKNTFEGGEPDRVFMFGVPNQGWRPVIGDWNGDGRSGVGLFDPEARIFYLKNTLEGGAHEAEIRIEVETSDLIPLAGDWAGLGRDQVALYDPESHLFHCHANEESEGLWPHFSFSVPNAKGIPLRLRAKSFAAFHASGRAA